MSARQVFNPLPVPTRLAGGEGVFTYAQRHARRNFSSVKNIEGAVREQGYPLRNARLAPERLDLWRQLGDLHPSAFTVPQTIAGQWVSDRPLCLRCAGGAEAHGRLPLVGNVCLRHRRWIGDGPQADVRSVRTVVEAERRFRKRLALALVLYDSPAMLVSKEAAVAALSPAQIEERAHSWGTDRLEVLVYPEQVRLASVLASPAIMRVATDPNEPGDVRCGLIEQAVSRAIPWDGDTELWRAQARLWHVITRLTDARRQAALRGTEPADAEYSLLRLL